MSQAVWVMRPHGHRLRWIKPKMQYDKRDRLKMHDEMENTGSMSEQWLLYVISRK